MTSLLVTLWALFLLYALARLLTPVVRSARRAYRRRQPCPWGLNHDVELCVMCARRWGIG